MGRCAEGRAACREEDTRVEGYLYSLQTVIVGYLLDLCAFYLFGLFGSLIHFFTDKGSGGRTYGSTYGGTDGSTFAFSEDGTQSGTYGSTATASDEGSFAGI